jgi:hypothetical protein
MIRPPRSALPWTGELKWREVVDVSSMPGDGADAKLAAAQQQLAAKGGGVVFFPAGEYRFKESIQTARRGDPAGRGSHR